MATHKTTIERGICHRGIIYDLVWEVESYQYSTYSAYLIESTEPEDRERKVLLLGEWNDDQYDGAPENYYAGAGMYYDRDDRWTDGTIKRLFEPETFGHQNAQYDAAAIIEGWYWPEEISSDSRETIEEELRNNLDESAVSAAIHYAANRVAEEAEEAEELIVDCKRLCGDKWRLTLRTGDEAREYWWVYGGKALWRSTAWASKDRDAWNCFDSWGVTEFICSAEEGAEFIRRAAKIPQFIDGGPAVDFDSAEEAVGDDE